MCVRLKLELVIFLVDVKPERRKGYLQLKSVLPGYLERVYPSIEVKVKIELRIFD